MNDLLGASTQFPAPWPFMVFWIILIKSIYSNEHSITMKKQDIFDAALSLIVSQGLHATPMAQIAKEANVAAGTIYHYFKSKEEMIHELYKKIHIELEEIMDLDDIDLNDYKAEFDAVCLRIFKYLIQNPLKFYFLWLVTS